MPLLKENKHVHIPSFSKIESYYTCEQPVLSDKPLPLMLPDLPVTSKGPQPTWRCLHSSKYCMVMITFSNTHCLPV